MKAGGRHTVLFVTPRYAPYVGGIETHVAEVGRRLVRAGFAVTVLTVDPSRTLPAREDHDGMTIMRVGSRGADLYWSPELYRAIRAGRWDLVHCQGIHTLVPALGMLAALRARTPFLVTFHTGGHDSRLRIRLRWLQWLILAPLLRRAAMLIAVSQFEAMLWHRVPGLRHVPIVVIPNGAEMPALAEPTEPDPDLIVSVGRLVRYKGHQRALEGLRALIEIRPEARLRIVGTGPYEGGLRRAVERLGLSARVEIAGIPGRDRVAMAALLARAGVVLLLSEYEAHPVAVLEAASLGRPVIAAETTGLRELIAAGLARGIPLDADPSALARAIVEELDAPARPAVPLPRWDDCAGAIVGQYESILSVGLRDTAHEAPPPVPGTETGAIPAPESPPAPP
jgi:glycosyltransferase involved in cell wall biosynthesis